MGTVKRESCVVSMLPYSPSYPFDWLFLTLFFKNFSSASPLCVGALHDTVSSVLGKI